MVNWQDLSHLRNDYITLVKLNHVMAGLYIWETVTTAGFELGVLRRKRPYRWTVWLYLGTRYTGLLAFICLFIVMDGPRIPCQPFIVASYTLGYASWEFASFIIVLRIIAIWNRNMVASLIAVGLWSVGLALNIRRLTMLSGTYSPVMGTCVSLHSHRGLLTASVVLVVDAVLFLTMLIGLLRVTHTNSTGIWKLLYQQCVIWFALALMAEVPAVAFGILNLNDAWNDMFDGTALTILSIAAARMYRSLSYRGHFTGDVSPSHPLRFSPGVSTNPTTLRGGTKDHGPIDIQVEGIQMTYTATASSSTDETQAKIIPSGSVSSVAHKNNKPSSTAYEVV